MSIEDMMDSLAKDGWCVVLKRLPPKMGWTIEGSQSEYGAPCPDREVGKGKWLAECSDMLYIKRGDPYRNSRDVMGTTAHEAMVKLLGYISEDKARKR